MSFNSRKGAVKSGDHSLDFGDLTVIELSVLSLDLESQLNDLVIKVSISVLQSGNIGFDLVNLEFNNLEAILKFIKVFLGSSDLNFDGSDVSSNGSDVRVDLGDQVVVVCDSGCDNFLSVLGLSDLSL